VTRTRGDRWHRRLPLPQGTADRATQGPRRRRLSGAAALAHRPGRRL